MDWHAIHQYHKHRFWDTIATWNNQFHPNYFFLTFESELESDFQTPYKILFFLLEELDATEKLQVLFPGPYN